LVGRHRPATADGDQALEQSEVTAMPATNGSPLRRKGWSDLAKTKGSTGRMQGLTMVSTPPR
jgi:hypothetical protein